MSAVVLKPNAFTLQMLDAVWFFNKEASSSEITEEGDEGRALVAIRVPCTAKVFIQCELFHPGMVLAYVIE